jgi:hypothetical protein
MQIFTNKEMRQKDVAYDKKKLQKSNSHCKQEDVFAVATMSYIGHCMIKRNYFAYIQR